MNVPAIMIIEDDSSFIYLMQRYVKRSGFHAISANSGADALRLARQEHPAMIILDLGLPGMGGPEILQALKTDPATRDIPIVLCTGWDDKGESLGGVAGIIKKPVSYQDFAQVLTDLGFKPQ